MNPFLNSLKYFYIKNRLFWQKHYVIIPYFICYALIYRIALFKTQTLDAAFIYLVRDFLCGFALDLSLFAFIITAMYFRYIQIFASVFSVLYISIGLAHLALSVQYKSGLANFSYIIEYADEAIPLFKTGVEYVPIWYIFIFWLMPILVLINLKDFADIKKNTSLFTIKENKITNKINRSILNFIQKIIQYIQKYTLLYPIIGCILFTLGFTFINSFYNNPLADNSTNSHSTNVFYRMIQSEYKSLKEQTKFNTQDFSLLQHPEKKHFESLGYQFTNIEYPLIKRVKKEQNKLTSKPNIVIIVMESVAAKDTALKQYLSVPGKDVTPFLDKLLPKSIIIPHFFSNADYTAGAETAIFCSTHDSLRYSMGAGSILRDNTYLRLRCLPKILNELSYTTFFFHSYTATFDNKHIFFPLNGIDEIIDQDHDVFKHSPRTYWGIQDKELFEYGVEHIDKRIQEQKTRDQEKPFFGIFLTVNNHPPYILHDKKLKKKFVTDETYNNYLNTVHQTDVAIASFFDKASKKEWYKNTIFIITSDNGSIQSYNTQTNKNTIRMFKMLHTVPFIIYSPTNKFGITPRVLDISGASHIDITPTILDILNLDVNNAFAGESLLNPNRNNYSFVYDWFNNYYKVTWPTYYNATDGTILNLVTEKEVRGYNKQKKSLQTWMKNTVNLFNYVVYKNKIWDGQ